MQSRLICPSKAKNNSSLLEEHPNNRTISHSCGLMNKNMKEVRFLMRKIYKSKTIFYLGWSKFLSNQKRQLHLVLNFNLMISTITQQLEHQRSKLYRMVWKKQAFTETFITDRPRVPKPSEVINDLVIFTSTSLKRYLFEFFKLRYNNNKMTYRRPAPRSPPRNFKVNFIEEPPLDTAQVKFIETLVPKIAKKSPAAEDIQF